ncbi:unnamed protein product [Closterium sp. NIES-54]
MTMNEAFHPLLDKCVIVYLDNILIYSPDRAQHLQDIEEVFKILSENRLLTKASKCEFLQDTLEFLGHIISAEGVEIDPKKIATIQAGHAPTNLTELKSFLGIVNYVRRFFLDMAKLTAPLTDLLRKGVEYTWGEKEQAAFSALKQILCSPPVLHITDLHRPFELVTDASDIAVGVVLELLLQEAHVRITSGHFKIAKTRHQLQRYYYWPELLTDVQHHVGSCPTCQVMKSSRKRKAGQLQSIRPPERAWQQVTMDFVMGLPSNSGGNDAVMVVVDRLTKMAHFAACKKSISVKEIALQFIAIVVRLRGIPAAIISDRDMKFTSNFWKNLWETFGTRLQFSSLYHPETDRLMERTNQMMEQLIRATCDDPTTWEQQLPLIELAYNNATSKTTRQSPFYLKYRQNPTVPMTPSPDNPTPRAQQFAEILQAAHIRAAEAIKKANVIAKRNADRHRRRHVPVTVTLITSRQSIHSSKDSIIIKIKDSNPSPRQVSPAGDLSGVEELVTPRVRQAAEAALGGVRAPTLLTSAVSDTENVGAGASTSTALTPSVPLTKLLRGGGLRTALLLLALTTTGTTPLAPPPWSPLPASSSRHGLPCPSRVRGQGHERYFLLVVDDYSRYTTVFPLRSKGEVTEGDPDAPDIPTPRSYAEAIEGPYSSQWQAAMDAEMAFWKSTGTYVDEVPPPGANIGVDYFQTFSPTPKMTTLRVLLHVAAQRDYELHSLDFSTAFLQGSLHEEIWLRRPPGFTGSFPPGTQWSLRRPVYGLRQAPHWCDDIECSFLHRFSSPPVLYVDNKAMLALCREHRLEHRTKHIALRYFLARELQQRGQMRLAYVASEANTADIFTKALAPGDHQRFCTLLGLVPTWPHLLTS